MTKKQRPPPRLRTREREGGSGEAGGVLLVGARRILPAVFLPLTLKIFESVAKAFVPVLPPLAFTTVALPAFILPALGLCVVVLIHFRIYSR
jgi:hypothetical protein